VAHRGVKSSEACGSPAVNQTPDLFDLRYAWGTTSRKRGPGFILTAPSVVGVFWPAAPGGPGPDPQVRGLFRDFVTDLFNGPGLHDKYVNLTTLRFFAYTLEPDISQNAGCQAGCGLGRPFDIYMEVLSHELFETVTDPYDNGWLNGCGSGEEEVADVCSDAKFFVPRRTSTSGSPQCPNRWGLSAIFSNATWAAAGPPNGCLVGDSTPVADLTISLSHTGNFAQGQIGDHYRITVGNATAGTTCGTVTVTESVPAGLTLIGLSGNGWACAGNTCTRSDSLSASSPCPARGASCLRGRGQRTLTGDGGGDAR
jgi:hypothetical protein